MRFKDIAGLAFNSIRHRRLRAWLTLLGIIIGVASVLAIMAIGEGATQNINERMASFGADVITVSPGSNQATRFGGHFRGGPGGGAQEEDDSKPLGRLEVMTLNSIPEIAFVNEMVTGSAKLSFLAEQSSVSVQGINPVSWGHMTTTEIQSGRYLSASDRGVVVIGHQIASEAFKQPLVPGNIVVLDNSPFRIVGVLKESLGGMEDRAAFITNKDAQNLLEGIKDNEFNQIQIKLADDEDYDAAMAAIEARLQNVRHVTERNQDFRVSSTQATRERINEVAGSMVMFLLAIAAVSLVVGSIGIANSMFTSVLEKIKEIGILKSLGASNEEILTLFLLESALFGLVGGIIGVLLATGIAMIVIPMVGMRMGGAGMLVAIIKPEIVPAIVLFSTFVGIVSGVAPAFQASKLNPVDALRYE